MNLHVYAPRPTHKHAYMHMGTHTNICTNDPSRRALSERAKRASEAPTPSQGLQLKQNGGLEVGTICHPSWEFYMLYIPHILYLRDMPDFLCILYLLSILHIFDIPDVL